MRGFSPLVFLLLAGLSGCADYKYVRPTYAPAAENTQNVSSIATCRESCERSFTSCADTDSFRRDNFENAPMIGNKAVCETSLQSCLRGCKSR
ncbi:MAG: hypothetical protein EBZ69_08195 [Alphaproteobacteria bacterium]|nr:hypothetical protein [Alphaproteobacteria bacterium]NDC56768.1 hypothetical protein [Alphaproteobacteria bacterium]NDG04010.1 hypothetical protein [Alphaproteobacteria bacterium]